MTEKCPARSSRAGLAAPEPQITFFGQRIANRSEIVRVVIDALDRQPPRTEAHLARRAVGDDVHRIDRTPAAELGSDLGERWRVRVEQDRLDLGAHAGEQRRDVGDARIDERDLGAQRGASLRLLKSAIGQDGVGRRHESAPAALNS